VRLSPETCRVKPLRRIKTQLLHLVGLISLLYSTQCTGENKPKCNINIPYTCFGHAGSSVGRTCWHALNIWHWTLYLSSLQYGATKHHTLHYSVANFGIFMDSHRLLCLAELEGSLFS